MITETELLSRIEAFCKEHGMPETSFGMRVLGDFNLVEDLRTSSRSPRLKTVNKILTFIDTYKPEKRK